ncbi:MAG: nucleoside transporter C-terminal domain-containing protein, partial [Fusobacterium sp.]
SGLIFAKLIMPEKSGNIKDNKKVVFHKSEAVNIADAAAKGTMDGLKMAVSMGALLVAFIGLITLANTIVADIGGFFGVNITIQKILGYLFSPLAYVMGIPWNEAVTAGSLLGEKMVLNEFVAYASFGKIMGGLSEKTITIMSFALLGFANISSIAILIGGVGGLAPDRKKDIAKMGVRAILGGFLASILNGIIAGVFFG